MNPRLGDVLFATFIISITLYTASLEGVLRWLLALGLGVAVYGWMQYRTRLLVQRSVRLLSQPNLSLLMRNAPANADKHIEHICSEYERLRTVIFTIREGVLALNHQQVVTVSNPMAMKVLACSTSPVGLHLSELRLPKIILRGIEAALAGEEQEVSFKLGEKPQRNYYELLAVPTDAGGCLMVIRDITKLRKLERIRRDFIANVSHELRTPITTLRVNAETLMGGAMNDPQFGPQFLSAILHNSERLSRIINDLLDLSRIESGQYSLNFQVQPLCTVVRRIVVEHVDAGMRHQHVQLDLPDRLMVRFDEQALEHILTNYLDNAIKYTPEEAEIWVRAFGKDDKAVLEVEDNGPGISLKHRSRLFERFYRVDKGRSRAAGGTGLGLAIVRNLAEAMGGTVGMRPAESGGAVFWVAFPIQEQEEV